MLVQQHLVERIERYGKPYYRLHPLTYTFAQTWLRGSGRLEGLQSESPRCRAGIRPQIQRHAGSPGGGDGQFPRRGALGSRCRATATIANQLAVALMQAGDFVNTRGYVYELLLLRRLAASSTSAFPAYAETPAPPAFSENDEDEEYETGESEPFESDRIDEDLAEDDEDEDLIEDEAEIVDAVIDAEEADDEDEDSLQRLSPVPTAPLTAIPADEDDSTKMKTTKRTISTTTSTIGDVEDLEESESLEDSEPVSRAGKQRRTGAAAGGAGPGAAER